MTGIKFSLVQISGTELDHFAILAGIIQNQQIREEHKLPEFLNYGKKKSVEFFIPEIFEAFEKLRKPTGHYKAERGGHI